MYNMVKCHCCDEMNVKRGLWTVEEDAKMLAYVNNHGTGNWTSVPKKAGLQRCGESCRLRWTNYLRPDLRHESFTPQEEELIILLHATIGSRWSIIAQQLPGKTDNDVKNYWNTKLKKKLSDMGIDPLTHKPFSQVLADYGSINGGISKPAPRIGALRNTLTLPKPEPFPLLAGEFNPHITCGAYYGYNNNSIDLLSDQLQAIKLVTEASNYQFLNENSSSTKSNSTSSSSSSSTRSTAAFENFDSCSSVAFCWKDFLLEDELIPSYLGQESCDSEEWEMVQTQIGNEIGGAENGGFNGSNFVDSMIDREKEMFSEFANLLEDQPYN